MKKAIAVTALVTVMGLSTISFASANCGRQGMRGPGGHGPGFGIGMMAEMDDATKKKFETFLAETTETRKEIRVKQSEKRALMHAENPDAKEVGRLTGEIFDLRSTMHTQAKAAGLEQFMGKGQGCGNCDGPGSCNGGKGKVRGKGMRGGQGAGQS